AQQGRSRRRQRPRRRSRDRVRRSFEHPADARARGPSRLPLTGSLTGTPAPSQPTAIRGPVVSFRGDPFRDGLASTMVHEADAIVVMQAGRVARIGPASEVAAELPHNVEIRDWGRNSLICAGFVDCHVHFPQTPMIAAQGVRLLDWLDKYTFPTELKFAD